MIELNNPLPLDAVYLEGVERQVPPKKSGAPSIASTVETETRELVLAKNYGSELLTREVGTAIRADVATLLSSGAKVRVVLDGIDDLTPSVADECFGKLAESMGEARFKQYLVLSGGQPIAQRLIEFVIRNRLSKK